jgi:anti-sigma factor RsiW
MTCAESQPLLHAQLDGELDLSASLGLEKHLESCPACSAELRKWQRLRDEISGADLDFNSGDALARIHSSLNLRQGRPEWRTPAMLAAVAAALVLAFLLPSRIGRTDGALDRELVDYHLRSLVGDHLMDVPSSDRHTVKPWFQGKIDFAPPVADLSGEGFVLVGGRLDVIDGKKVAALIYKRREHIINLWISPGVGSSDPDFRDISGYHLLRWTKDGLTFQAVSDLEAPELRTFGEKLRAQ